MRDLRADPAGDYAGLTGVIMSTPNSQLPIPKGRAAPHPVASNDSSWALGVGSCELTRRQMLIAASALVVSFTVERLGAEAQRATQPLAPRTPLDVKDVDQIRAELEAFVGSIETKSAPICRPAEWPQAVARY